MKSFTIKNEEYEKVESACMANGIRIHLSNPYRDVLRDSLETSLDTQIWDTETGEEIDKDISAQFTEEFIDAMATKAADEQYTHYWDRMDDAMEALMKNKIEELIELKRVKNLSQQGTKAPVRKTKITLEIEVPEGSTLAYIREIEANVAEVVKVQLGLEVVDSPYAKYCD